MWCFPSVVILFYCSNIVHSFDIFKNISRSFNPHHNKHNLNETSSKRRLSPQEAPALRTEKPLPFMLLYTTSVGSNWLMTELSHEPTVCCIGIDPLDDICGDMAKGKNSGNGKRQLGWLRVALTPPNLEEYSDFMGRRVGRGDAWKASWRLWKLKLVQHSLPCRAEEVSVSCVCF
jgi:hypothetical protein